jgi:hypothetical protein
LPQIDWHGTDVLLLQRLVPRAFEHGVAFHQLHLDKADGAMHITHMTWPVPIEDSPALGLMTSKFIAVKPSVPRKKASFFDVSDMTCVLVTSAT